MGRLMEVLHEWLWLNRLMGWIGSDCSKWEKTIGGRDSFIVTVFCTFKLQNININIKLDDFSSFFS